MDWLPPLLNRSDFPDEATFYAAVYHAFEQDWIYGSGLRFGGMQIRLQYGPLQEGREYTFYHMTTEGEYGRHRTVAVDRCERIRWAHCLVANAVELQLPTWLAEKHGNPNWHIALPDFSYIVVLSTRPKGYLVLTTAFPVSELWKRRKLRQAFEAFQQKTRAAR